MKIVKFGSADRLTIAVYHDGNCVCSLSAHVEVLFDYQITTGLSMLPMLIDLAVGEYRRLFA
jgi:hypothetical protein